MLRTKVTFLDIIACIRVLTNIIGFNSKIEFITWYSIPLERLENYMTNVSDAATGKITHSIGFGSHPRCKDILTCCRLLA